MKREEKVIMYDSPEAAERKTVTGWVSGEHGGQCRFWGEDEHMARYCGATHKKCECGNVIQINRVKCDSCYAKVSRENYLKMPFREWDGEEAVCIKDGDKYFFHESDLIDYMEDNDMTEIELLICEPNSYSTIDTDYWDDLAPEDWDGDLPKEMQEALDNLNKIIEKMPPLSYSPGKIRTTYKLNP